VTGFVRMGEAMINAHMIIEPGHPSDRRPSSRRFHLTEKLEGYAPASRRLPRIAIESGSVVVDAAGEIVGDGPNIADSRDASCSSLAI
jgi:hypothetical protein